MILIVDDDASITASLALLLKQNGYASGAGALADRRRSRRCVGERPRLVIQDMNFSRADHAARKGSICSSASAPRSRRCR